MRQSSIRGVLITRGVRSSDLGERKTKATANIEFHILDPWTRTPIDSDIVHWNEIVVHYITSTMLWHDHNIIELSELSGEREREREREKGGGAREWWKEREGSPWPVGLWKWIGLYLGREGRENKNNTIPANHYQLIEIGIVIAVFLSRQSDCRSAKSPVSMATALLGDISWAWSEWSTAQHIISPENIQRRSIGVWFHCEHTVTYWCIRHSSTHLYHGTAQGQQYSKFQHHLSFWCQLVHLSRNIQSASTSSCLTSTQRVTERFHRYLNASERSIDWLIGWSIDQSIDQLVYMIVIGFTTDF